MTVLITCPGLHLARPTPGWQLITWNPMIDYVDRVRVVTATCCSCGSGQPYRQCCGR
ncbi:hypothetical protein [Thermoactinospora rubra]|uniref:hypothetical protein n=1 Tax=Thermoactinospora rubra TaxID=1088767 RepID=UPI001301BF91|nr:hypothetical protein [Thermoactinospora rubra]